MIDGEGGPNTAVAHAEAIATLYAVSYTLKFLSKATDGVDHAVMPLEGPWWTPDIAEFSTEVKSAWEWTAMIMQPARLHADHAAVATAEVRRKKDPAALDRVRFEPFAEGLSVQILYLGQYADEAPAIERPHGFARHDGYQLRDEHHEIYLSDPRRVAPAKLRTVIRQPIEPATRRLKSGAVRYCAVQAPSTTSTWPDTMAPAGDAR
jgi:hypothetical protein